MPYLWIKHQVMDKFILTALLFIVTIACQSKSQSNIDQTVDSTPPQTPITDISAAQARDLIKQDEELIILDVRTQEEYDEGAIEGAILIDFYSDKFSQQLSDLEREASYVVYCKKGGRSTKASKQLADLGFKRIYNMVGGYTAWSKLDN